MPARPLYFRISGTRPGLSVPGYIFEEGLSNVEIVDSNLEGTGLGTPKVTHCKFARTNLRQASLAGAAVVSTHFEDCGLELADFSGARFEKCGSKTWTSRRRSAAAGPSNPASCTASFSGGKTPVRAPRSSSSTVRWSIATCTSSRPSGIHVKGCKLSDIAVEWMGVALLEAEGAQFERCSFRGLRAPRASLAGAKLRTCMLGDADLRGADLKGARLEEVDFQPRACLQGGPHRHGDTRRSPARLESGFYAGDLSEGVYLDPEVVRYGGPERCRSARGRHREHGSVPRRSARREARRWPAREGPLHARVPRMSGAARTRRRGCDHGPGARRSGASRAALGPSSLAAGCRSVQRRKEEPPKPWRPDSAFHIAGQGSGSLTVEWERGAIPRRQRSRPGDVAARTDPAGRPSPSCSAWRPRRDGPGRPFDKYYTQTPTHLWIHDLETGGLREIVADRGEPAGVRDACARRGAAAAPHPGRARRRGASSSA
jgi:hypothetical protein